MRPIILILLRVFVSRQQFGKHFPAEKKNCWWRHFLCSCVISKESRRLVLPRTSLSLPSILEGSKNRNSAETRQGAQNLRPISPLSTTGELLEKLILRKIRRQIEERNLLNESQFNDRTYHSTTLQCMRLKITSL
jgi:hypothetical protein